ncbi:PREDICTED: disintegrin and metalloproteinase domain-containing protein 5-like [Galeopterus variegatus]|uniref:Disintegrin and metalloproteinase domain-containing protein 5-like n=1 Tax=Galeopterus variegatus TaxID=482537 RepID=A0ABM0SHT2_GALVR|nr:PREDICTED: disintegrin and metalloproteinase domain-containing protein 5-like [Galeopterus variegatus]
MRSEVIPMKDYDMQYTYLGGQVCVSAHLRNTSRKDNTYTDTGSICGEEQVCNDHFNCHCDVGYSPPTCEPAPSSPGGSIDDGYWIATDRSTPLLVKQATSPKNGLLISFYVFLPFLILTAILVLKWNKMKGFWNRVGTVSSKSPLEDNSSDSAQSYSYSHDLTMITLGAFTNSPPPPPPPPPPNFSNLLLKQY